MRLLLSLVVVVLVASAPAHADNREDARKEFALGQQADKDKDYQTAIEHYLRAYELVPHHFALYNIATAYERLGQLREAARWYERYLDEAPQSLVKERREVEKLILELKLRPAKLTIKTAPPGARVLIDGQPVGVTPYTKPIRGGGHRVRVELEGQREERDIVLEYGEPQTIEVTLNVKVQTPAGPGGTEPTSTRPIHTAPQTQTSGMVRVTGSPEGALVAIDDQVVGRVGGEFHVEPGRHNLKVTMYGYQTYDQELSVATGQATDVEVKLAPGTSPPVDTNRPVFGYYAGGTFGADVRGSGAQYMGELGYRIFTFDLGVRVGKAASRTTLDVMFRWTILKTKLSPFVVGGYSAAASEDTSGASTSSSSTGYLFGGGLRYDAVRSATSAISILAESGVRLIASSAASDEQTLFIPLLASVQITFGGKTTR